MTALASDSRAVPHAWMPDKFHDALSDDAYINRHRVPALINQMIGSLLEAKPVDPKKLLMDIVDEWQFACAEHLAAVTVRFAVSGDILAKVPATPTCSVGDIIREAAKTTNDSVLDFQAYVNGSHVHPDRNVRDVGVIDGLALGVIRTMDESLSFRSLNVMQQACYTVANFMPSRDALAYPMMFGVNLFRPETQNMRDLCTVLADHEDTYGSRRRTVDFALRAAQDREMRISDLVVNGPGICLGSIPNPGDRPPDASWNSPGSQRQQRRHVFEAVAP